MTPTEALARALFDMENQHDADNKPVAWSDIVAGWQDDYRAVAQNLTAALAALGYEVRPICIGCETAHRAHARPLFRDDPIEQAAEAAGRDSIPLERWVLPEGYVFDGARRLYANGQPLDRWEIRAVRPIHSVTAEAADREAAEPILSGGEETSAAAAHRCEFCGARCECPYPHFHEHEQAAEAAARKPGSGTAASSSAAVAPLDGWQQFREHLAAEADRIGYSHTEHYDGPGNAAQVRCIPATIAEQIAEKYWPAAPLDVEALREAFRACGDDIDLPRSLAAAYAAARAAK